MVGVSHDVRCPECGRKLLEVDGGRGSVKCPRCGAVVDFECTRDKINVVAHKKPRNMHAQAR